jgi:hypothetical protein
MAETASTQSPDTDSYEITRFNALRHGMLSRYTVLPWEDQNEYCRLLDALVVEHKPKGPTEEHLVEEMVGVIWRKRRLRLAEASAYRRSLKSVVSSNYHTTKAALVHLDIDTQASADTTTDLANIDQREIMTDHALDMLQTGGTWAYNKAIGALSEETRERWEGMIKRKPELGLLNLLNEESRYTADANGLLDFLRNEEMPSYEARRKELQNRSLIREQALGEALDVEKLEGLGRYEIHLDRKLERMLTMLIRLQELGVAPARA